MRGLRGLRGDSMLTLTLTLTLQILDIPFWTVTFSNFALLAPHPHSVLLTSRLCSV